MVKKKAVKTIQKEWSLSEKLTCDKYNNDINYIYRIPSNVEILSILIASWIYTDNKDRFEVSIKSVVDLNNYQVFETKEEKTTQGTAWSSGIYTPEELIKEGILNIKTIGSPFKKGLNITLQGYINE